MDDLQWNKAFAMEQTGDDAELLEELLGLFVDSSAKDLARMRQALLEKNTDEVIKAAHSLKGASASLGIEGVREIALKMEDDARAGSLAVTNDQIESLASLLDQVKSL